MLLPNLGLKPAPLKQQLRTFRFVHFAFIVAALLQLYMLSVLRKTNPPQGPPLDSSVSYALVIAAIVAFAVVRAIRRNILEKVRPLLQQDPPTYAASMQWAIAMILGSAISESMVLFGWVICFLGTAHPWTYIFLWSLAAQGFILSIPQSPIDETSVMPGAPS